MQISPYDQNNVVAFYKGALTKRLEEAGLPYSSIRRIRLLEGPPLKIWTITHRRDMRLVQSVGEALADTQMRFADMSLMPYGELLNPAYERDRKIIKEIPKEAATISLV